MQPLVPKESIQHILWALMFLKTYWKESTLSTMAGGVDEKTWRKLYWPMVQAIANFEPIVVSCHNCHFILPFIIVFPCHICLTVNCYYRLIEIIVMLEILEMIA